MQNIKILHIITESCLLGGAQRNTLITMQGLKHRGYIVELACGPGGPMVDLSLDLGLPVKIIDSMVREISPITDLDCLMQIYGFLKQRRFDIIHTHSTKAGLLGRLAGKLAQVPIIIHTIHGTPFAADRNRVLRYGMILSEKLAGMSTDKLIAVGDLVKQEFLNAGICRDTKIETIYSGIDFDEFDIDININHKKLELGIAPDAPVVGAVGHLVECKGHKYLIEAAVQIKETFPDITFIIAGEGPLRNELEAQISRLDLESTFRLLGDRDDVPEILSIMDVYAQPSLWEGLGRAMTEAMYMKKPVIASNVNAVPELVENGKTGVLVPPRDVSALVEAIKNLLENEDKRRALGRSAHKRVFPAFSADLMIGKIEDLYLRLIDKKLLKRSLEPTNGRDMDGFSVRSEADNHPVL